MNNFTKKFQKLQKFFKQVLNKTTQGVGKVFKKTTQGEFFFQNQLKPMGYYSARKCTQDLKAVNLHIWPWGQQMSYIICVWPLVHTVHIKVLKKGGV